MVDRQARDIAGKAIQDLVEGSVSNKEYERRYPSSKGDPALWGIFSHIWFCYSDTSEHTLTGKHALTDGGRAFMERCLLFLRSDLEFRWRPTKLLVWYPLLRLVGLGWVVNRLIEKNMNIGDVDVWPFFKKAEYEEVSRQPSERRF